MNFMIYPDQSGFCIWTRSDSGVVYREKAFDRDFVDFDEPRLNQLLEQLQSLLPGDDVRGLKNEISALVREFLRLAPKLEGAPVLRLRSRASDTSDELNPVDFLARL